MKRQAYKRNQRKGTRGRDSTAVEAGEDVGTGQVIAPRICPTPRKYEIFSAGSTYELKLPEHPKISPSPGDQPYGRTFHIQI